MENPQQFLDVALEAVKKAEPVFRKSFGHASGVEEKIDQGKYRSPVTDVDKEIETIITSHLHSNFPEHSISGEEFPATQNASEYTWFIDPIDGTINYIRGLPFCSISVGLWKGETAVASVVADPMAGAVFTALKSAGSYKNGTQKLRVSTVGALGESMGNVGRTRVRPDDPALERVARKVYRGREFGGAALELCAMAEGKLDFYISERTKIFDNAAGMLIVTEAGGRVTDWNGGPYVADSKNIVASNSHIHAELLRELKG